MQTAQNLFNLISQDLPANVRQIAVQWPGRSKTMLSSEDSGFSEIMAALTTLPPEQLQNSVGQLEWVPLEEDGQEFAPLIDLSKIELDGEKTDESALLQTLIQAAEQNLPAFTATQVERFGENDRVPSLEPSPSHDNKVPFLSPAGFRPGSETMPVLENTNLELEKKHQGRFKDMDLQTENRTAKASQKDAHLHTVLKNHADALTVPKEQLQSDKNQPVQSSFQNGDLRDSTQRPEKAEDILNLLSARHLAGNREQAAAATPKDADIQTKSVPAWGGLKDRTDHLDTSGKTTAASRNLIIDPHRSSEEQNSRTNETKQMDTPEASAVHRKLNHSLLQAAPERSNQQARSGESPTTAGQNFSAEETKNAGSPELAALTAKTHKKSTRLVAPAGNPATVEIEPADSTETKPALTSRLKKALERPAPFDKNFEGRDLQPSDKNSNTVEPATRTPSQRDGFQSLVERWTSTSDKGAEPISTDPGPDSIPKEMKTDVIRQIVQRMSLRSERLHSKMNIKLKPEFLGEIRLQIHTQNQMVTVRMTADSPEIKEIIEKNIQFLKTELQQHGLEIDKFDVLVGEDREGSPKGQNQTGFRQAFRQGQGRPPFQHPADKALDTTEESVPERDQTLDNQDESNEISYFA